MPVVLLGLLLELDPDELDPDELDLPLELDPDELDPDELDLPPLELDEDELGAAFTRTDVVRSAVTRRTFALRSISARLGSCVSQPAYVHECIVR